MERGEETDWRWWCVLFLVQVKTLQNGNGGWALARIEWLVNASSKDATQDVLCLARVRVCGCCADGVAPCCDTFLAAASTPHQMLAGQHACESTRARAPKCKSKDEKNYPGSGLQVSDTAVASG